MRTTHPIRDLALATASPVAGVALDRDGTVEVTWANEAMTGLLGLVPHAGPDASLSDVLTEDSRARLAAVVRDLLAVRGRSASVEVSTGAVLLRLHLLVPPAGRWPALRRAPVAAVLHAEPVPDPGGSPAGGLPDERAQLVDRLGAALLRLRRHPSRVAVAVATVGRRSATGYGSVDAGDTAELARRVRRAARETDTVAGLRSGVVAVLTDDPDDDGIALARRMVRVLRRPLPDGRRPVVGAVVLGIDDPDADPEQVLGHLEQVAARNRGGDGLTVLRSWSANDAAPADDPLPAAGARPADTIRAALASGRFVLCHRPLAPLAAPEGGADAGPPPPVTLLEVCTVDDGVATPVRVDAPGLATALDRWAVGRLGDHPAVLAGRIVVRLQPGGTLAALQESVTALRAQRSRPDWALQMPEARLEEAAAGQAALLGALPELGGGLAVADWTGRVDVRTLVALGAGTVQLAPGWEQDARTPGGGAELTALVAGLRAGLGPQASVIADGALAAGSADALGACGVRWGAGAPVVVPGSREAG